MKAMLLRRIVSLDEVEEPLELAEIERPELGAHDVLLGVSACGVCHTELDEIEGRTPPPSLPVVPGHEVVGRVVKVGESVTKVKIGERLGVGWIHHSNGAIDENVANEFRATGRDVDGGYAEFMTAHENYAFPIPEAFSDMEAAPLLCAGAIGYRAVRLANLSDGERIGLTGFGGSAHLVLQMVRHLYPKTEVFVFARDERQRAFAGELGAVWCGDTSERAPERLHAIIDTTPAWRPVVKALGNLRPGGRLVINAIRKEDGDKSSLLDVSYHEHLWLEREIKTVANITAADIREYLPLAAEIRIRPQVTTYPLAEANRALVELKRGSVEGAKVLMMDSRY